MFGADNQQQDGMASGMMPQNQPSDNSLGMPSPSSPATNTMVGAPMMSDSEDSAMPPADEIAASDAPASMSRDAQAQTPDDLMNIKQSALQDLKPLVGHLDQSAEERFRMTMMMIQATDDQSLIPDAYEAAKSIEDEKTRAQALLDVVNEINYFSQQNK